MEVEEVIKCHEWGQLSPGKHLESDSLYYTKPGLSTTKHKATLLIQYQAWYGKEETTENDVNFFNFQDLLKTFDEKRLPNRIGVTTILNFPLLTNVRDYSWTNNKVSKIS